MEMETPPEENIITNSSKYLKLLQYLYSQGIEKQFLRGSSNAYTNLTKRKVGERKPSLTPENIFNIADEWFEDNFGIKARSQCIFVTTSMQQASEYGHIHYVFPIKSFTIIHSDKVDDLFAHLSYKAISEKIIETDGKKDIPEGYNTIAQWYEDNDYENFKEAIRNMLDEMNYKKNDYVNAFESGNEIMVYTKSFYVVEKQQWIDEFLNEFVYDKDVYDIG